MLNRVILIGRLTRDPEMRYTANGTAVCRFALAVNRPYTNQAGEREADFIDIVTWRQLAETCANYLGKGRLVAVEGRLQVRTYEGQDGQKRKAAEVVAETVRFLDRGAQSGGRTWSQESPAVSQNDSWDSLGKEVNLDNIDLVSDDNEEIPF